MKQIHYLKNTLCLPFVHQLTLNAIVAL
jgi:hypothetical protein